MAADTTGRRSPTDSELDEMYEHSKNDHWIWVGSDIRILVAEVRALRASPPPAAPEASFGGPRHDEANPWPPMDASGSHGPDRPRRPEGVLMRPPPTQDPRRIKIEVVYQVDGGEEIGLYAEGHHEPAAFLDAVEAWRNTEEGAWLPSEWSEGLFPADVRHERWRNEPGGEGYVFRPAKPSDPGSYPVTCFAFEGGTLAAPKDPEQTTTTQRRRETTVSDYDRSIHSNPDAAAWAAFFAKAFPAGSMVPDEGTMLGWFANAMMAMHDAGPVRAPGAMTMDEARQIAAQAWCDPETSGIEMDVRLAEAFARRLVARSRREATAPRDEAPNDAARALDNIRLLVTSRKELRESKWAEHLLRFCREGGSEDSILRGPRSEAGRETSGAAPVTCAHGVPICMECAADDYAAPSSPATTPPCGGSRCRLSDDETHWIHSSKSYSSCAVHREAGNTDLKFTSGRATTPPGSDR